MFKFPLIELIDRYCIAKLKFNKLGSNAEELSFYKKQIEMLNLTKVVTEIDELYSIHQKMWDYENEFKKCIVDKKYSLEEIGRRAIIIRDINLRRNSIKNKIADKFNDPIKDIKQYG